MTGKQDLCVPTRMSTRVHSTCAHTYRSFLENEARGGTDSQQNQKSW